MSWDSALDAFEQSLAAQRAAVAAGTYDQVVAFTPPPGLGPLPPALAPRARALLVAADDHTRQVQALAGATQRELALLGRMHPEAASPSYVDQAM